ncbi:tetratricopeptide repeat protein [Chryseobacterium sp. T20]|uniref:tetratricopeptide repeat protein n=1 Tax=Chryseobacterium sp. T20 TaxID=3395375 RepID=UPI0039BC4C2F
MNEQEIEKLLQKISNQKMFGETEKAIANLHILNNEFPKEKKYLALLASSYLDADSVEVAEEYCAKALEIDPSYPEIFELKGLIAEKRGDDELAEKYYKESISTGSPFKMGHLRLVLLYYKLEKYEDAIKEAEYLLANFDIGRNEYSADEQRQIFAQWLSFAYNRLYSSLIRIGQYEKAANKIKEFIAFRANYVNDPYQFLTEDEILFKLYHALNDEEKMKEMEEKMLNHYMLPESMIDSMKKDAQQGYLESANPENYAV